MARSSTTFKPGAPGRPKGIKNKRNVMAEEWAQGVLGDEEVRKRIIKMLKEEPLNEQYINLLVFLGAYAWGKPIERSESTNTQHNHAHGDSLEKALAHAKELRESNGHSIISVN